MCAGGRRPVREPSALLASLGASSRSPARPRRRPPAPPQVPPAPFTPVMPGHWRVVGRVVSTPGPAFTPQASCSPLAHIAAESTPNVARNSPATLSNIEFRSLELQRFRTLLKLRPIELRARFRGRGSSPQWCANWCIGCLFGATRCRVETAITFARPKCVCGIVGEQRCRWFHAYPRTSEQRRFHLGAKKFALWRCVIAKARRSSPCALKTPQIRRF